MREWITRVMTAAILSALLELLAPEGKMRRYVSFAIASLLLIVLLSPLGELRYDLADLGSLFEGIESEDGLNGEAADNAVLSLAETALAEHIADRFSLALSEISLELFYGAGQGELCLRLLLPPDAPLEAIASYLKNETSLVCEVSFK